MKHLRHLQGCANCRYAEPLTPKYPSQATVLWLDFALILPPFLGGPAWRKSIDSKYKQGSKWYSLPPKLCLRDWPTKASPKMTDWTMKRLQSTSTESSHSQPSARKPRSAHIRRAEAFQLENSVMYFTACSGYILQIRQLLQSFPPVLFAASGARSFRWRCPVLWRHANHFSNWLLPHSASQVMVQFKQKK